jgi:3-polyprenyl-4-hydroxybenzoate decarboxylase
VRTPSAFAAAIKARVGISAASAASTNAPRFNPHGLGYAKIIIVVDADVDPFNLDRVT